jgi:hypothetical protein
MAPAETLTNWSGRAGAQAKPAKKAARQWPWLGMEPIAVGSAFVLSTVGPRGVHAQRRGRWVQQRRQARWLRASGVWQRRSVSLSYERNHLGWCDPRDYH